MQEGVIRFIGRIVNGMRYLFRQCVKGNDQLRRVVDQGVGPLRISQAFYFSNGVVDFQKTGLNLFNEGGGFQLRGL